MFTRKSLLQLQLLLSSLLLWGCMPPSDSESPDTRGSEQLKQILEEALLDAPAGISGMSLLVNNERDERLFDISVGDFSSSRRCAVASASKLVTGLVVLRLVEEGALKMTDTPGAILGWQGTTAADATIDHLGAFVSGLSPEALCVFKLQQTLQECVAEIGKAPTTASPGERFDYGSTHLAVLAAMAEVATSESWASLFDRTLKTPLGLQNPDLRYVTLPKMKKGGENPLVAGGLLATADEYMSLLAVLFHKGQIGGHKLIASDLVERFGQNLYPNAIQGVTPTSTPPYFRYSWSSWLNCPDSVTPCNVVSSPGAFGFSPWVDWDHGYYAVLAMEADKESSGSKFSVPIMEMLRPKIEAFLD